MNRERERERERERIHLKKTDNMVFKNHVFSLCIPNNLNQTAVELFWLDKNN